MITDVDAIEAALAVAGWRAGAEALVGGWGSHQRDELRWEETWDPDDRCSHVLQCSSGECLVLEWISGDTWELSISWPEGWGREHLSVGWREDLEKAAEAIVHAGGPFGGPQFPQVPTSGIAHGPGRRLAGDVELRFELLRDNLASFFFIARDGTLNNLWIVSMNPDHLPAALDSLEGTPRCAPSLWLQAKGKRRAWRFTAWRPLLARAQIGARELLLSCPDASTAVVLAHTDGHLEAAVKLEMRELPNFDAGAWLARAAPWPSTRHDLRPAELPGALDVQAEPFSPPADAFEPSGTPIVQVGEILPPTPASNDNPYATSPLAGASKAPRLATPEPLEPAEQSKPRFTLSPEASPEDIQRHFTIVEAAIPPRLTGTATAVELWDAIRNAHKHRALPISGNWVDLVAVLHHRGFLARLPGDRASRAALLILANLTPLVRRLHHRRWALGMGS